MFIAERFMSDIVDGYGDHPVAIDSGTWYPHQACQFLNYYITFIPHMRKVSFKGRCNMLKIERKNVLMITFHVEKRNAN